MVFDWMRTYSYARSRNRRPEQIICCEQVDIFDTELGADHRRGQQASMLSTISLSKRDVI